MASDRAERTLLDQQRFFCSWSGGKDSALSLARALASRGTLAGLLTMMTEERVRSRSHGIHRDVLAAQARAIGVPLRTPAASWAEYEGVFRSAVVRFRVEGASAGVFGDLDFEENRRWVRRVCEGTGIRPIHPLWGASRDALLEELVVGFRAVLVAVNALLLPPGLLGRTLDAELLADLRARGIDPSGERGEYHTLVLDAPYFAHPIRVEPGRRLLRDGYWFQDFQLI